jgi:hypothetical protein
LILLVGAGRFERPTPCAQGRCATRLRYAPTCEALLILNHFLNLRYLRSTLSSWYTPWLGFRDDPEDVPQVPTMPLVRPKQRQRHDGEREKKNGARQDRAFRGKLGQAGIVEDVPMSSAKQYPMENAVPCSGSRLDHVVLARHAPRHLIQRFTSAPFRDGFGHSQIGGVEQPAHQ